MEQFSDIGRIEALARLFKDTCYINGDETHFTPQEGEHICSASRLFLEGTDFDLVYFPLQHLGYKCVVAVAGELYAHLARPRCLNVVIGVSAKLDFAQISQLWEGIWRTASDQGFGMLTLDLIPSQNGLSVSLSATGAGTRWFGKPQSKDLLCVSGNLGGAYFGQRVLQRGKAAFEKDGREPDLTQYRMMIASYLKPELNPALVEQLEDSGITPTSGCLVTRGLADAVKRIAARTALGVKVYADKIPFEAGSFDLGRELDIDPVSVACGGGEDYRLLLTVPIAQAERFRHDFQTFDIIGHLALKEVGTVLVTPEGVELPLRAQGWPEEDQ